jgi:hypothetical protein
MGGLQDAKSLIIVRKCGKYVAPARTVPDTLAIMEHALAPALLEAARERLRARLALLNAEIREYPQPIARCDAQLGGLVEERARLRAELDDLDTRIAGSDRRL